MYSLFLHTNKNSIAQECANHTYTELFGNVYYDAARKHSFNFAVEKHYCKILFDFESASAKKLENPHLKKHNKRIATTWRDTYGARVEGANSREKKHLDLHFKTSVQSARNA